METLFRLLVFAKPILRLPMLQCRLEAPSSMATVLQLVLSPTVHSSLTSAYIKRFVHSNWLDAQFLHFYTNPWTKEKKYNVHSFNLDGKCENKLWKGEASMEQDLTSEACANNTCQQTNMRQQTNLTWKTMSTGHNTVVCIWKLLLRFCGFIVPSIFSFQKDLTFWDLPWLKFYDEKNVER